METLAILNIVAKSAEIPVSSLEAIDANWRHRSSSCGNVGLLDWPIVGLFTGWHFCLGAVESLETTLVRGLCTP